MVALTGLPRAGSWLDVDFTDEIAVAMLSLGATQHETATASARNPIAAYSNLQCLGVKSDLLRIVGSLGDTLGSQQVLRQFRQWNTEES